MASYFLKSSSIDQFDFEQLKICADCPEHTVSEVPALSTVFSLSALWIYFLHPDSGSF